MEERNSVSCDNGCCTPLQKRENVPLHGLHEKMRSFGFIPLGPPQRSAVIGRLPAALCLTHIGSFYNLLDAFTQQRCGDALPSRRRSNTPSLSGSHCHLRSFSLGSGSIGDARRNQEEHSPARTEGCTASPIEPLPNYRIYSLPHPKFANLAFFRSLLTLSKRVFPFDSRAFWGVRNALPGFINHPWQGLS